MAVNLPGVSTGCGAAIISLATMSDGPAVCLGVMALAPALVGGGSFIDAVDKWAQAACSATPCTDAQLKSGQALFDKSCVDEIKTPGNIIYVLNKSLGNYTTLREAMCSKTDGDKYCLTDVLTTIQTEKGSDLDMSWGSGVISGTADDIAPIEAAYADGKLCTQCSRTLAGSLGAMTTVDFTGKLTAKCGTSTSAGGNSTSAGAAGSSASNAATSPSAGTATGGKSAATVGVASASIGAIAAGVLAFSAYVL